jgi:hypothetical protein
VDIFEKEAVALRHDYAENIRDSDRYDSMPGEHEIGNVYALMRYTTNWERLEDDMKKLLVGMMAVLMLIMTGCGDGAVSVYVPVEPVISPPSITSYGFTKDRVAEYIDGSVEFFAPDSDIDTITVAVFDPYNRVISRTTTRRNLQGVTRGTIFFSIDYAAYPSDAYPYSFSVYLSDFNGYTSNQAYDSFYVP